MFDIRQNVYFFSLKKIYMSNFRQSSSNNYAQYSADDTGDVLQNVKCSGNIMLEPRLQEYIKKRKYYKSNNIQPDIPLEREFSITNTDRKLLKSFLTGNLDIYKPNKYNKIISEKPKSSTSFPSSNYKDDPRVLIPVKQDMKTPINRGMFVPDKKSKYYEDPIMESNKQFLDARDFADNNFKGLNINNLDHYNVNEPKFNPRLDPKMDPGPGYGNYDKCNSAMRISDGSIYDSCAANKVTPQNKKKKINHNDNTGNDDVHQQYLNYDLLDEYEDNMNRIQDVSRKVKKPKIKSHPDSSLFNKSQKRNTEIESELIRGMPTNRPHNRSYGYRDTFENNFDYIDDDFQNPDNTDLWPRGGEPTRLENKLLAKNRTYVREVM